MTGGTAVLALIAGPAYLFIEESRPYSAPRQKPPAVRLSEADLARAQTFPAFPRAIPVLTFHDVSRTASGKYTLTPSQFAAHVAALREAGFNSVGVDEVARLVTGQPVRLPSRPILLTFDDGPTSNFTVVDPILARFGYRAVAFLISGRVASREPSYYLTWDQARALRDSGRWEFGAHTHRAHGYAALPDGGEGPALMNRIVQADGSTETFEQWKARVFADFEASTHTLRRELGEATRTFAFPFGAAEAPTNDSRIPAEIANLVAQRFGLAFHGSMPSPVVVPSSPSRDLPRIGVVGSMSASDLLDRLRQEVPLPPPQELSTLPWRSDESGTCVAAPAQISLTTAAYSRCQVTGNPAHWEDYRFTAAVRGHRRAATAILSVRSSHAGRVEVAIGESTAKVRQQLGKSSPESLGEIPLPSLSPDGGRWVALTVQGDRLAVEIDTLPVAVFAVDRTLRAGFAGFAVAANGDQTVAFLHPTVRDFDPHVSVASLPPRMTPEHA